MSEYSATELDEMCGSCIHKVSKEDVDALIQQGRAEATDEIRQIIHNIYTQDLYCKADLCEKDEKGYDCEDCLFSTINQNLEHIKEQK